MNLQARLPHGLTIAYRQRQQVEETRRYAARSLVVAAAAQMPEYTGTAKANQAWVAWQAGEATLRASWDAQALTFWRQLPAGHGSAPFQWLALWPLIAVALHEEQLFLAVDYARALLDPGQQRLPDALAGSLEQAVQAWDGDAPESAQHAVPPVLVAGATDALSLILFLCTPTQNPQRNSCPGTLHETLWKRYFWYSAWQFS